MQASLSAGQKLRIFTGVSAGWDIPTHFSTVLDAQEAKLIFGGIQQGNGRFRRPLEGPWIDDAQDPVPHIRPDVRMAQKEVVMPLLYQKLLYEPPIIPMRDGDPLAPQFELRERWVDRHPQRLGVPSQ